MSQFNSNVLRIYGGMPSGDVQVNQGMASPQNQAIPEVVAVGTTRRMVNGPRRTGHISLQFCVDSAAGATSAATVWYSNLPNPSLASDADWVQDTTIASVDLTATGTKIFQAVAPYEWVMVKLVVATSTGGVRVFYRAEGTGI